MVREAAISDVILSMNLTKSGQPIVYLPSY